MRNCDHTIIYSVAFVCRLYTSLLFSTMSSIPAQEDCARQKLVCFLSVERGPSSATEHFVLLELVSGTICRRTSDSLTCHIANIAILDIC